MVKKILKICIPILIIVAIIIAVVLHRMQGETIFNTSYVNGNTAGNLYNSGLFCEYDGILYFANANDGYHLYSMTIDGQNLTKLNDDNVSYINADANYLYYVRNNLGASSDESFSFLHFDTNSLVRCSHDGSDSVTLDSDASMYASLVGNYVYYIHYDTDTASTLYRIQIDGEKKENIASSPYTPCSTQGQYLYYNGIESDHNIYEFDTSSGSASVIYSGNCWMPQVFGTTAYAMNCEDNYSLLKIDLTSGTAETIVSDRIDCYNVYGNYIYYQKNDSDNPALYRIKTDGTDLEEIASGNYTEINVTSDYVYFRPFANDNTFYRTPTSGEINVTSFVPGSN